MRQFYTILLYLLAPLFYLRLWWRGRRNAGYRQRIGERFGRLPDDLPRDCILIHAVSVGESQATQPLVRWLSENCPDLAIAMTTTTPTGAERVQQLYGSKVRHLYFPYDLPVVVGRYLDHLQPRLVIVMETEIWPNLSAACGQRKVPLMLVNGRLSESSAKGYGHVRGLISDALANYRAIVAQTPNDAARFLQLGAAAEVVHSCGSIKFDINIPASVREQGELLRAALGSDRPVWIAASTHEGEESEVLDVHRKLLESMPETLLILVPRHPERFERVAAMIEDTGLTYCRRSETRGCEASSQVYLGDIMGELPIFYGASDVALVAGSLAPVGGHNILEAAALSVPVIVGPHMHNFLAINDMMLKAGASIQVPDAAALATEVEELLGDPIRRNQMGQAGLSVIESNQGAMECVAGHVAESLGG